MTRFLIKHLLKTEVKEVARDIECYEFVFLASSHELSVDGLGTLSSCPHHEISSSVQVNLKLLESSSHY